ncbi:MAG: hypothetical protein ACOYLB_16145 [Phototrophicaceae bacterium]
MATTTGKNPEILGGVLQRSPAIVKAHPLFPLALPKDVKIVTDGLDILEKIDNREHLVNHQTVILDQHPLLVDRFPTLEFPTHPSIDAINANMRYHLPYMREHLLTNHKVADYIQEDVSRNGYDVVVLLLIDGLSYGDVYTLWGELVQPCFIDGVSVTYQHRDDKLLSSVGFASIINSPSIQRRLYHLNYRNHLGFTYWKSSNNVVSRFLFDGISNITVESFKAIVHHLKSTTLLPSTYIQIMREGLDGLAHGKRELHPIEIESATHAINDDVKTLLNILEESGCHSVLYVVADHGILWKTEHDLRYLPSTINSHSRYTNNLPQDDTLEHTEHFKHDTLSYYLYVYPYIDAVIPKNHHGVHGGLSYQESLVPFAKFEVTSKWS